MKVNDQPLLSHIMNHSQNDDVTMAIFDSLILAVGISDIMAREKSYSCSVINQTAIFINPFLPSSP